MLAVQRPNVDDNRLFDMSCLCLYVFASASALSAALLLDFHRKSCGSKLLQRLRLVGFEGCAKRDPRFYEGVAGGKDIQSKLAAEGLSIPMVKGTADAIHGVRLTNTLNIHVCE